MTPNENMELAESNTIDDEDDVFLSNGNEPDDDVNDGINDATPRIPSRQPVPIFTLDRNNRYDIKTLACKFFIEFVTLILTCKLWPGNIII